MDDAQIFLLNYTSKGVFSHWALLDVNASPAELSSEGAFHVLYFLAGFTTLCSLPPLDERPLMLTTACIDCGRQRAFVTGAESAALAEPLFSECPNGCFAVNLDLGGHL